MRLALVFHSFQRYTFQAFIKDIPTYLREVRVMLYLSETIPMCCCTGVCPLLTADVMNE